MNDSVCGLTGSLAFQNNCYARTITLPFMFVDPPFLYASDATFAWLYRNRWHESMYYAVAPGNAPNGSGTCVSGSTCLSATGLVPGDALRGLVVLPGPRLTALGQSRPPAAVTDWLEGANNDGNGAFALRNADAMVNRTFNDHLAVVDSN